MHNLQKMRNTQFSFSFSLDFYLSFLTKWPFLLFRSQIHQCLELNQGWSSDSQWGSGVREQQDTVLPR